MPSDVSVDLIAPSATADRLASRRLPVGVGLTIGACASVVLWTVIGLGVRALFV